jgi:hypothetical protein
MGWAHTRQQVVHSAGHGKELWGGWQESRNRASRTDEDIARERTGEDQPTSAQHEMLEEMDGGDVEKEDTERKKEWGGNDRWRKSGSM